mgnify:FL=1|tara:strand:- start:11965 stop:13191 length:1227 start_codon:yes stop_codon:yes gene_type:complete
MANINSISILTTDLNAAGENRSLSIQGEVGAQVTIQVVSSDNKFYNFVTSSFSSSFSTKSKLEVTLTSGDFSRLINFPAGSSVKYFVIVSPKPYTDTVISGGVYIQEIGSISDSTITFAIITDNTAKYASNPVIANTVATGSPSTSTSKIVNISGTISNATTDSNSQGLFVISGASLNNNSFQFDTTKTISSNPSGDGVAGARAILSDITDLVVGMRLIFHKGTTAPSSTTVIQAIDTELKQVVFSTIVPFEDGETMTLRASGLSLAASAIGASIALNSSSIDPGRPEITTNVRAGGSGTTINVTTTQGIPGGSKAGFTGISVDNSSTNNVNVVTPDPNGTDGDGVITCDLSQSLTVGTKLTFTSENGKEVLTTAATLNAQLTVTQFPQTNKTINVRIDDLITPGTVS